MPDVNLEWLQGALSKYENKPSDVHHWGLVTLINPDGSFQVKLNASDTTTRCANACTASVGDRVLVLVKTDGKCVAVSRLGGEGGGTIPSEFENLTITNDLSVGNSLTVGGREYGVNEILWSGDALMTASQTITLLEAISAQPNGVIFAWSGYVNGAQNYDWLYFFVPKLHVIDHNGAGVAMPLATVRFGTAGSKYVYISDTSVRGNDYNTTTGAQSSTGVSVQNNYWVLRNVIGV